MPAKNREARWRDSQSVRERRNRRFVRRAFNRSLGDRDEKSFALANDAGAFRTRFHLEFKRRHRVRPCQNEFSLRFGRTAAPQRRIPPS